MAEASPLWVSADLVERIRQHGAATYPDECCGALFGRDASMDEGAGTGTESEKHAREVLGIYPMVNRREDSRENRFSVTTKDVVDAERAARQQGLEVIGWYHSHPDHPARPSQYDQEHAWPWYSYIIVSVQKGATGEMNSWRLSDDRKEFAPEPIAIRQSAAV